MIDDVNCDTGFALNNLLELNFRSCRMLARVSRHSQLVRLMEMLRLHCFYQENHASKGDSQQTVFLYGPPGTLLRKNVEREWWKEIVLKREHAFPVSIPSAVYSRGTENNISNENLKQHEGSNSLTVANGCLSFYHDVLQSVDRRLPFSLACIASHENTAGSTEDKLFVGSSICTQLLVQEFCAPVNLHQAMDAWLQSRLSWWKRFSQHPSDFTLSEMQTLPDGSSQAQILYQFPWGSDVVETVWNRGDNPLKTQETCSGLSLEGRYERKTGLPAVLQCETSLERATSAFLLDALEEKVPPQNGSKKSSVKEPTLALHLHPQLAPYKLAVAMSGSRTRELRYTAGHLIQELQAAGVMLLSLINVSDTLEACFTRSEQMGIPYTLVINDNSLETGLVGLRSRDTLLRESVAITKVKDTILDYTGSV